MNSRVIAAITAAILALVGIVSTVVYASSAKTRAYEGAELVKVYRLTADVGSNSDASTVADNVEQVSIPVSAEAKGAITDLSEIEGLKTTVPLAAGEQLIESRFDKKGAEAAADTDVPAGLQEVAVTLDPAAAVGGRIDTGAKVGVIVTVEDGDNRRGRMIAQNILVTKVDKNEDATMLVTLAVTTAQATQIATGAQFGQVRLSVQNDKTNRDGASSVDSGSLVK